MLDHTLRYFKRELNNAMESVLDFRRICKKYFLYRGVGEEDSDEEMFYGNGYTRGSRMRKYE